MLWDFIMNRCVLMLRSVFKNDNSAQKSWQEIFENFWKQFMNIHWENIKDGFKSEYKLLKADQWIDQGELYDYNSIMHYLSLEYSKGLVCRRIFWHQWKRLNILDVPGRKYTMTRKDNNEPIMSTAPRMTSTDVVQLAKMYSEFCQIPTKIPCPGSSGPDVKFYREFFGFLSFRVKTSNKRQILLGRTMVWRISGLSKWHRRGIRYMWRCFWMWHWSWNHWCQSE